MITKTPNPSFTASESTRQADGVRPHLSVRGRVEPYFRTADVGKSLPLPALLLALALPSLVQAQFTYVIDNGAVTITEYTGRGGAETIPATVEGSPVTGIGPYAFYGNTDLISVVIPNTVTHIGEGAFAGCVSLHHLAIPDNVVSIGGSAFSGCTEMTSVMIGNGVTHIPGSSFRDCTSLADVTIPNTVTNIGGSAFSGCTSLVNLVIPDSVTSIEDRAFNGCASLASVTIPASVTTIGEWAFSSCTNLASVMIPSSVTSIGAWAFYGCASLDGVTIPASVTDIGSSAFYDCARLTAIMVDEGNMSYSSLDGALFDKSQTTLIQCPGGKAGSFTIPASVTSIDYRAFRDGASLTSITVEAGNALFSSLEGVLFDKNRRSLLRCPEGRTGRYTIPNNVSQIGELAFAACAGLTEITIPASVTAIAMQAFAGCTSLTEMYFLGDAPFRQRPFYTGVLPTIYYLPGTTGWRDFFEGRSTVLWDPQIQTSDGSFGVQSNQFGFNLTASSELTVVVEASSSVTNPTWAPVGTNTLAGGTAYFSDPQWINHPARCYRLRSP